MDLTSTKLALNGGVPVRSPSKLWKDNYTTGEEEKIALTRVIDSGYMSLFEGSHTPDYPFSFEGGPEVQALEDEWSEYYDVTHSISVNSATSGLYASVGALGLGYGDEVIVSPYTMSACAIAPMIYGAIPVFADVELNTGSLDADSIRKLINPNTKAIIVVHQFGIPANMKEIMCIAREHNLKVIEDCAQAHGARIDGKYVGTIGDIGVFSLNVNKTIQSGEGGICVTNDDELCYRLQLIRNHGEAVVGPADYENITNIAGFNYRMTELNAAVARVQLKKLDHFNEERIEMVGQLAEGVKDIPFLKPLLNRPECDNCTCSKSEQCKPTFYVFPMRFLPEETNIKREDFIKAVNAEGIMFYQGYVRPLYLQPVYQKRQLFKNGYPFTAPENKDLRMNYAKGTSPVAERLHFNEMIINEHIRLPNSSADIDDIINSIHKVYNT